MNHGPNNQIRKFLHAILLAGISLSLCLGMSASPEVHARQAYAQPPVGIDSATTRHGGWLDEIDFSVVNDLVVIKLLTGALDVYANPLNISELSAIQAAGLKYATLLGQSYAIMYNPAVCADSTRLNPFNDRKIREATNMLYDRNAINQQIYAGIGTPKFFVLQTKGPDYTDLADVAQTLEAKYAFNEAKAIADIAAEMTALGATKGPDGKWQYNGSPVTLVFLIRNDADGTRLPLGDYAAGQLEKAGFSVDRQYKKSSEASPIWQKTSTECLWNAYTAGWMTIPIERDERGLFQGMYLPTSPYGYPQPFGSNVTDPVFLQVGDDLANANFTSLQQRHNLMAQALPLSLQDSLQVMINDKSTYVPYRPNVQIAADRFGGIENIPMTFPTVRFAGVEGGVLKWGETDLFTEPWNPVAGSTWGWDQGAVAATSCAALMYDPYTGLQWPLRAERAELTVKTGLPVFKSLNWITLKTADTINVPADAWVDWNATTQTFIPAGLGKTARIKSVITYPADMFDSVTWHDGSKLSVADFVMNMIMTFDRAKPASAIYDEAAVYNFDIFKATFKGVKIVSTNPLVIETYSDAYQLYAERNITSWWPKYGTGEAPWQAISVANLAEAAGESAYSPDKAALRAIDQTNFIGGPTLAILANHLDQAIAARIIPFAPTMGAYLSTDEALARYTNLKAFYTTHNHFWVGSGPYYLDTLNLAGKTLALKNFAAYPDLADRWSAFSSDQPTLAASYSSGAPGSAFLVTGSNFPLNATATISINGHAAGTVPTDVYGGFTFSLQTSPTTAEGLYRVTVSVNPSASTQFTLDAGEMLHPQAGIGKVIVVPDGIAFQAVELPLVMK